MQDKDPVTLVILGASGDLTHRLLLPGLGTLLKSRPEYRVNLVGAAADDLTADQWADRVREGLAEGGCPAERVEQMVAATRFEHLDVTDPAALKAFLADLDAAGHPIVLYFALPPAVSIAACEAMTQFDLPEGMRLAIEKPFGSSYDTAHAFNRLLTSLVPERQMYRVDHYLGKATVLNLLGVRFGNRIFEPIWDTANIEQIEVIADESLALEGRAGYYDHAGALRDMIQSHLLLVMAMVAMEEPARIDEVELRDLIVHTLRATHLAGDDPLTASRRARYTAGSIDGKDIPSYVAEEGVDAARNTETLAEVNLEIRNSRWAGVPFRLRSGKALWDGFRGIVIKFRPVVHLPEGFHNTAEPNVMVIGLTPETLAIGISTNAEGGQVAAGRLIESDHTAIICGSDLMALGAIREARSRGLEVPRDLSVVGFDDSPLMAFTDPALTTVRQPVRAMCEAAVSALLRALDGTPLDRTEVLFHPDLIIRRSTAPAP